ncbi:HNH endonuclease signature motif containing protein [Corynebacterium terpenotabidum]|uniref:DUF222 domain-containing protein n=1 Tax=Corynebacterium terpenotabidum Y-11 TaxID=1200352 RepID=S4XHA0_9CORY|nr:HNH endonuclease signature motif containing protein [Corynebacterium terpenotabidum]AGP31050.1 hypothetical protein A606_07015 [Corynebacterium terpenotabidum Y-11]
MGGDSGGNSVGSVVDLAAAVDAFAEATAVLADQPQDAWDRLDPEQRERIYRTLERGRRRTGIVDARFLCAHERHIPAPAHRARSWLVDRFGMRPVDARSRVAATRRLDARGDAFAIDPAAPGPAHMPELTAALVDGDIDIGAVAVVDSAIDALPADQHDRITASVDQQLIPVLRAHGMADLGRIRPWLTGLLGSEGIWDRSDHRRLRGITIGAQRTDGMSPVNGLLEPEAAAVLQRLMADHAKAGDLCDGDAAEDMRTPEQRRHDALMAAVTAGYGRGKTLTPSRGTTTIVAAVTVERLLSGDGTAPTDVGVHVPVSELRATTEAADLFCQFMDLEGKTLALGRSRRLGSLDQYLALVGEEGVSSAPGSSTPPVLSHMHHIDDWASGGPTDLDNLTLAAPGAHTKVNDRRDDPDRWETRRGTDGRRVDWIPPVSQDRQRRPLEAGGLVGWDAPGRIIRGRRACTGEDPPDDAPG